MAQNGPSKGNYLPVKSGKETMIEFLDSGSGHVFVLATLMVVGSVWTLFFHARVPIPAGLPRGATRATLEIFNQWLKDYGGWAGCFFLPIGSMLVLGVMAGGLAFYHWPIGLLMFAVLAVWKMR